MILTLALVSLLAVDQPTFIKAVQSGDAASVHTMLDADATLANAHTPKGNSAVIVAMMINKGEGFIDPKSNEVLQSVLARHPKLDIFDTAAVGTREQLEAMLKGNAVDVRSPFGWTPLHLAAFAGNVPNTELLIARGADINARAGSKFLNTPLQTAMLSGQYATAKILIDHGADVLVRQSRGFTPLHEAALLGRQDLVQLLIDHGAELNSRSDSGKTPLSEAIRGKHDDLAAWLKAKGALVEEDKSGD
jgi:ankyrin repeat protein